MQELIRRLRASGASCVVRNGAACRTFTRRGIADLYDLLAEEPDLLRGASVADKVVGKGAAALLILGGVARLHALVVSSEALALLRRSPIEVTFDRETPRIENRERTGPCPLESRCRDARTAAECRPLIDDFVRRLRGVAVALSAMLLALCAHPAEAVAAASTDGTPGASASSDTLAAVRPRPIDEVVVTGTRRATDPRLLPMTVSVLTRREIEQAGRASLLPTLTEQIPGLFVTGRGVMGYGVSTGAAGAMSMRGIGGAPTTGLLVLVDGQPQYMGLMGHPIADACQASTAERVEVLRGPASVLNGSNAAGGVLNIVTRRMREDGFRLDLHGAYGSYNTLESDAAARFRKGRLSGILSGSYNRTDGHRADMGFEQAGGFAKLGLRLGRDWEASADLNVTRFDASNPGPVTAPLFDNDARITRGRASFTLRNDGRRFSGAFTFFHNWGLHRIDDGYGAGEEPLDYRFRSRDRLSGLSFHQTFRPWRGGRLTAGADYRRLGGEARRRYLDGRPDTPLSDETMHEAAAYAELRQRLSRRFSVDAGLRYDRRSRTKGQWVPQGGFSWQLPRGLQLKGIVAKGFRYPTIREMYMFPPQNPDLKPEELVSYEISLSQRIRDGRFRYAVNLYRIDGRNMILLEPVDGRPKYLNSGRVRNRGVEVDLAWRLGGALTLRANYSYLHMRRPIVAAPGHKLFCGIDFAKGRWSGSTGLQLVRGLYTQTDPARRERFGLWNARLNCRLSPSIELFARGENLLRCRYEIHAGYPMPRATALGGVNFHF